MADAIRHPVIPPLKTEAQVRALPAVAAVYAKTAETHRQGVMTGECLALLLGALHDGGVGLGAYDARILNWLSGWGPETCAAVAGWIGRAFEAGLAAAGEGGSDD